MFPKKNRISKREFDGLMKNGRVFHSPFFSLRIMRGGKDMSKFAFVISKKVAKNAADRNKLKRRGFHALREIIFTPKMDMKGYMAAFFYKKEGKNMGFDEIRGEIQGLLKKSGVL
ncbi:MAG: ribonuclease P protein component [Candidatus Paceibacterota bacterium]|jgi:ribonuclease P protein component|nr:ribonuclease P protein component [Candidatus Paceibacterota bacterium]